MYTHISMVLTVLTSLSISLSEQSNHNRLNVYFEPQDAKSTSFIKNELFPLFQNASDIAERVSLKLVPFGNAICNTDNQDYGCVCSQGPAECDLMRLMACTLHDYRRHENALDTIACIQGRPSLEDAINNCVKKLLNREADWLKTCPNKFRGKYLSWINGLRTKTLSLNLTTMPIVILNGQINLRPVNLRSQMCRHLNETSYC